MSHGQEMRAEGAAGSVAGARWAAMKQLEELVPELDPDEVAFETLEEGERVRVAAYVRQAEERESGEASEGVATGEAVEAGEPDEADEVEHAPEPEGEPSVELPELPEEPAERVRAVLKGVLEGLDLQGEVEVEEGEEEIVAAVSGEELGLLIGRHGQTIDAVQLVCFQAAFRGEQDRKRVVVDAEGYRERRAEVLHRQADRAAEEAVRYGEGVEMETMSSQERRVVHAYLKERSDVETHSEGDDPYRFVVVTPAEGSGPKA